MLPADAPSPWIARRSQLAINTRPAIVAEDGALTHQELALRAGMVAAALLAGRRSLQGEAVALLARPSCTWVAGFLGILEAGGVAVPLSSHYTDREILYILQDAEVKVLLVDGAHVRTVGLSGVRCLTLEDLPMGGAPPASCTAGDRALMLYTSGTTGKPKGVVLTHQNLEAQTRLLGEAWRISETDRLLHALPLHHMHGVVIALLTTLQSGGSTELLPRFDPMAVWDGFARSTVWMGVPTMYHKLLDAFEQAPEEVRRRWREGARGLRLATSGSAALPATLATRWEVIAGVVPLERFGMTELGVALTNPLDGERKVGSVGRPLSGVEVQVVDEEGRLVAPGEPGEIVVRGPTVFAGYHRRGDATREAFRGGWFCTGDTATLDQEGYVRILGRTSVDILKSGGYKLSALEIEEALGEHPGVGEVAVVGLPDEAWGQRVVAAVVPRSSWTQRMTGEELRAFCRERLASYKVPKQILLTEELPRNAMGKIVKQALVERLRSQG
ncbi:MAG: acyl-CoA synthetase [Myxococcales bacterium]|nr:acyl-CoA synthetase [Polyangiaceae bacterium]MDW8250028.1 acyl-CoA synthetase [Myxococcales bacterium]